MRCGRRALGWTRASAHPQRLRAGVRELGAWQGRRAYPRAPWRSGRPSRYGLRRLRVVDLVEIRPARPFSINPARSRLRVVVSCGPGSSCTSGSSRLCSRMARRWSCTVTRAGGCGRPRVATCKPAPAVSQMVEVEGHQGRADAADRRAAGIEDRGADAAGVHFVLLVVDRESESTHVAQVAQELVWVGDGVCDAAGQAGAAGELRLVAGLPEDGEQPAGRGAPSRSAGSWRARCPRDGARASAQRPAGMRLPL